LRSSIARSRALLVVGTRIDVGAAVSTPVLLPIPFRCEPFCALASVATGRRYSIHALGVRVPNSLARKINAIVDIRADTPGLLKAR